MKVLLNIMLLLGLLLSNCIVSGQEANLDTSVVKTVPRPHILYAEVMGRAGYWNIGYGYSFFQRGKHELNATVGFNYMYYWNIRQISMFPVGIFYRFGDRFKVEAGFTVTTVINWPRFRTSIWYDTEDEMYVQVLNHQVAIVPSLAFVYGFKNKKVELGIRYTPIFNSIQFDRPVLYAFGAFFYYRLKQTKK